MSDAPSLVNCLKLLDDARKKGQWAFPNGLYPHEEAQLTCYVLQTMGHRVELERHLFTVKSEALTASGVESAMVYSYCVATQDTPGGRVGLDGSFGSGGEAILKAAAEREYPGSHISRLGSWDLFKLPRLSQYQDVGRQYRLTPQEAAEQVARGVAALEALVLDHATAVAHAGPKRRI